MLADRIVDAQMNAAQAKAAAAPVGNARAQQLFNLLQNNENVRRALQMIRSAEGTQRYSEPERVNFGNSRNAGDLRTHPNIMRPFTAQGKQQWTSATGAYQFLGRTWNNAANALGLPDFSRQSQDIAALYLIQQRGALNDAMNGNVPGMARKLGNEWASLGYNSYGQPTRGSGYLQAAFNAPLAAGGTRVDYATDSGGRVAGKRGGGGSNASNQPSSSTPYAGDFTDVNPVTAFIQSASAARNSPFTGEQSILQQLLQDQQTQYQSLLASAAAGSTTPQQQPTAQGAPILFGA